MQDDGWRRNHERFACELETSLSRELRLDVQVRLQEDRELTGAEFLEQLEKPTCLYWITAESWCESIWLDMNPAVLHPMLDRMLGGGPTAEPLPKRPLTDMEIQLARRILKWLTRSLERVWGIGGCGLDFAKGSDDEADGVERPFGSTVRGVRFEITLGGTGGMVSLAWPTRLLESLRCESRSTIGAKSGDGAGGQVGGPSGRAAEFEEATSRPPKSRVEVRVGLAETRIGRHELHDLSVGDIITTDHGVDEPLEVRVGGVPRFLASPGILGDRTAFRILRAISAEDGSS